MLAHHEVDDKRGTSAYSCGAVHKDLAAARDGPEHELVGVVQVSLQRERERREREERERGEREGRERGGGGGKKKEKWEPSILYM